MNSRWCLIPIRAFSGGKGRLGDTLTAEQRAGLARAMLEDVLSAARAAQEEGVIDGIAIVSSDAAVRAAADGIMLIDDEGAGDLNSAITRAAQRLMASGAQSLLILPADVPTVMAQDIATLFAALGGWPGVALVEAARDGGTNALLVSPPDAIALQYGPESARRHGEAAIAAGLSLHRLALEGLAHDIDVASDLDALAQTDTCSGRYLFNIDAAGYRLSGSFQDSKR